MVLDIDTFTLYFYKIDTHTHTISIKNMILVILGVQPSLNFIKNLILVLGWYHKILIMVQHLFAPIQGIHL